MYSVHIWHLHSELVSPHKEVTSSAEQGAGSRDNCYPPRGRKTLILQVDAWDRVWLLNCYINSNSSGCCSATNKCLMKLSPVRL